MTKVRTQSTQCSIFGRKEDRRKVVPWAIVTEHQHLGHNNGRSLVPRVPTFLRDWWYLPLSIPLFQEGLGYLSHHQALGRERRDRKGDRLEMDRK